jgi:hypothetical protein
MTIKLPKGSKLKLPRDPDFSIGDPSDPNVKITILCALVSETPRLSDGSKETECHKCQKMVWISPESQKIIADNPGIVNIWCAACAFGTFNWGEKIGKA